MAKKLSMSEKVRRMIEQGYTNKDIVHRLDVKPQIIYNLRYQMNKARGLGALGASKPAAKPQTQTQAQRRKVNAGTGIVSPAAPVAPDPILLPITMIEPPEPMWKTRIKNVFRVFGFRG